MWYSEYLLIEIFVIYPNGFSWFLFKCCLDAWYFCKSSPFNESFRAQIDFLLSVSAIRLLIPIAYSRLYSSMVFWSLIFLKPKEALVGKQHASYSSIIVRIWIIGAQDMCVIDFIVFDCNLNQWCKCKLLAHTTIFLIINFCLFAYILEKNRQIYPTWLYFGKL